MKVPENKNAFLTKTQKKYNRAGKEKETLKPKETSMSKILDGVVQYPEKLHVSGPIGETSVKKSKPRDNPEHGKDGKEFSEK